MRIAFIITGLETGGAEMMLLKVLSRLRRDRYDPVVVSLRSNGEMAERFRALPVTLYSIGLRRGAVLPVHGLVRLILLMRALQPDLVQGWMYHGNLAAQCVAGFLGTSTPVLWNVRAGGNLEHQKRRTRVVVWLGGRLSHLPDRIVNNSMTSATAHEQRFGYRNDKSLVIPNGFDTDLFAPNAAARARIRLELGLPESAMLFGLIGRYHAEKNHAAFLRAAAAVRGLHPEAVFLLAGAGTGHDNRELVEHIDALGLAGAVMLLGRRDDMPAVTAALDVSVCCSLSESFPNVVGEAMSCAVPCIVTDVGDCAWIVADSGIVVPRNDEAALVRAMSRLVELGPAGRQALGARARARVCAKFSLDAVVSMYENLYESVAARH